MAARGLNNRRTGALGHLALERWRNHPVIGRDEIPGECLMELGPSSKRKPSCGGRIGGPVSGRRSVMSVCVYIAALCRTRASQCLTLSCIPEDGVRALRLVDSWIARVSTRI